jgi:drug/metabolite transporter (DMT)-like permease
MAAHLWSIIEAQQSTTRASRPDSVGYAVGLLSWLLAAGVFVVVKGVSDQMPSWTLCFWRVFLAALILLPVVRGSFGDIRQFVSQHGIEALLIGAFGLGLAQGLAYTSLDYTSAVNFGIIFSTTPIITLVLAGTLLREPLGPWQALGSLVAFTGIVTITVKGDPRLLLGLDLGIGDLLAVAASVAFAGYTVLLKRAKFELARLPLLVVLMTGGAIASFPFFLYELASGQHDNLDVRGYLALAYMVSLGGAVMYLCYIWSIDALGAARAGALLYSQMVFTAVLAWLFLGESIAWYHYLGSGLIVVGIVLVSFLKPQSATAVR